jgi:hypothetical protein
MERNQLLRVFAHVRGIPHAVAKIDLHIAADDPTQFLQGLCERRIALLRVGVSCNRPAREHTDAPHPLALPRPCRERPHGCRTTEQSDELASFQLIEWHSVPASQAGL